MSKLLSGRSLRRPFVATLAAAAATLAPACGGSVSSDLKATGDAGGDADSVCPSTMPAEGSSCSGSLSCGYGSNGCPPYAECQNGVWTLVAGSCNPPAAVCPAVAPVVGAPCNASGRGSCSYPDACLDAGGATYTCLSGSWQTEGPPPPSVACPATPPSPGSSCAACVGRYPSVCGYGYDCGGGIFTQMLRCDATSGTWTAGVGSCNPPPVDAGPIPDSGNGD